VRDLRSDAGRQIGQLESSDIADVRGKGLLVAVEFTEEKTAAILSRCLEQGLLLNAVSPTILRIFPALTITEAEIDEAMDILEGALD
jgi:acetylornithine/N-succinyldiaminopimelate aminotransferase